MHDWSYGTINFTAWFPHNTCNANATLKAMGHLDHILGSKFVNQMLKLLGHWSSSPYVLQGWFISHGRFSWTLFSFQLVAMLWSFHVWYRQKKIVTLGPWSCQSVFKSSRNLKTIKVSFPLILFTNSVLSYYPKKKKKFVLGNLGLNRDS